jgi:hypothetical protein
MGLLAGNGALVLTYINRVTTATDRPLLLNYYHWLWTLAGLAAGSLLWLTDAAVPLCCMIAFMAMLLAAAASTVLMEEIVSLQVDENPQPPAPTSLPPTLSPFSALKEVLSHPLQQRLLILEAVTPFCDVAPIAVHTFAMFPGMSGTVKVWSSLAAVLIPITPAISQLTHSHVSPQSLAAYSTMSTAVWTVSVLASDRLHWHSSCNSSSFR